MLRQAKKAGNLHIVLSLSKSQVVDNKQSANTKPRENACRPIDDIDLLPSGPKEGSI